MEAVVGVVLEREIEVKADKSRTVDENERLLRVGECAVAQVRCALKRAGYRDLLRKLPIRVRNRSSHIDAEPLELSELRAARNGLDLTVLKSCICGEQFEAWSDDYELENYENPPKLGDLFDRVFQDPSLFLGDLSLDLDTSERSNYLLSLNLVADHSSSTDRRGCRTPILISLCETVRYCLTSNIEETKAQALLLAHL